MGLTIYFKHVKLKFNNKINSKNLRFVECNFFNIFKNRYIVYGFLEMKFPDKGRKGLKNEEEYFIEINVLEKRSSGCKFSR